MIGYCCINQTLRKQKVYTGRSIIRRTFTIDKASELALQNCRDLLTILQWNKKNDIDVFRVSSNLFPRITDRQTEYKLSDLRDYQEICSTLAEAGEYAFNNSMTLSCHPNPYTVLGSDKNNVVENSIDEIEMHELIAKLLFPNDQKEFNINFHVGCSFSVDAAERFCRNFDRLSDSVKKKVVVENDDKPNGWSVRKLYEHIHRRVGIPITFDYHHSQFSRESDISIEEEFQLAKSTWSRKMEVHFSESPDLSKPVRKHSDYITQMVPEWLFDNDKTYVLFECKEKELAVMQYRDKYFRDKTTEGN